MTDARRTAGRWYHGTPNDFETFDPATLGAGNDQLGSGFYFTDAHDTAWGYAGGGGYVFEVELAIGNPLPEGRRFAAAEIEAMLRASPEFDDLICNWGEVDFEGEARVVGRAVQAYVTMNAGSDDALAVLKAISNDMWQGNEAAFLTAVTRITGHDGLVRKAGREYHAVAWAPAQVKTVERRAASVFPGP